MTTTDPLPTSDGSAATGQVVAVVPLRDGVSGKSRLAAGLTPPMRRRLVAELARHVIGVLAASPDVTAIVVVTADPAFVAEVLSGQAVDSSLAGPIGPATARRADDRTGVHDQPDPDDGPRRPDDRTGIRGQPDPDDGPRQPDDRTGMHGQPDPDDGPRQPDDRIGVLRQPDDRPGLNAALDVARDVVRRDAPGATLLVVHADLPGLTSDDVAAVLAASPAATTARGDAAAVVVATDRHGTGTNLLLLPAGADFTFRFGPGSRAAHEAEAARRGLRAVVVDRPGTAADLDTLGDWDDLPAQTREHLAG